MPAPVETTPPAAAPAVSPYETPAALECQRQWEEQQPAIVKAVTKALSRLYQARPGSEVKKVEERGRQTVTRRDGTTWQQSLDETVQWTQHRGEWELALPWQVIVRLRQLEHQPNIQVAKGGWDVGDLSEEERVSQKLFEVARQLEARLASERALQVFGEPTIRALRALAAAYRLMPVHGLKTTAPSSGCRHSFYYTFKPLPSATRKADEAEDDGNYAQNWQQRLKVARDMHDHDLAWACEMMLRGRPERLSNFYIEPLHTLKKADGTKLRVFRLHTANRVVPEGPLELDGESYSAATKLRAWLNRHATGVWHGGDVLLQLVIEDCSLVFDQREVEEVSVIGWHPGAKAWFTQGCCVDFRGEHRRPDANGVFLVPVERPKGGVLWRRFKMAEKDKDEFTFALRFPDWKPDWNIEHPDRAPRSGLKRWRAIPAERKHQISLDAIPHDTAHWFTLAEVRDLFSGFTQRAHDMVGGWNAYMGLGWVLSHAGAPELFALHGAFPGYWVYGEVKQGKSTWAMALMKCLGYSGTPPGVSLESSTGAGGETVMQQYHNLPAWFEEAQSTTKETLLVVLKAGYNRVPPQKRVTNLREVLTAPLVVGVATCGDAQIRSRYPHQLVSEKERLPRPGDAREAGGGFYTPEEAGRAQNTNYDWITEHQDKFVLFWRLVLERRPEFIKLQQEKLQEWLRAEDTHRLDARARLVHGICYASFCAMVELLGLTELRIRVTAGKDEAVVRACQQLPTATVLLRFRQATIEAAQVSASDVASAAELDRFFKELMSAFTMKAFGEDRDELQRFFKFQEVAKEAPPGVLPGAPQAARFGWTSFRLFIRHDYACKALLQFLRKGNEVMPLREDDIARQMAVKPYWVSPVDKYRFGKERTRNFWVLDLDHLDDWGYRPHADDDPALAEWMQRRSGSGAAGVEWEDPRMGPLYEIIRALKRSAKSADSE